jgi:alanine dehydrogenase
MAGRTVGLPRMHKEAGERRDFLPDLVGFLERVGAQEIVLEEGYGSGMGLDPDEYRRASARVRFAPYDEVLAQDVVVVVRCPDEEALRRMRRGAVLVAMLHFPTRPARVALLRELGLLTVSLDQVKDDLGNRLVQNMASVGWNGVRAAFQVLARQHRRFEDPGRRPIRVTLMGSGAVGGQAVRAAVRYGDLQVREAMAKRGVAGVEVTVIDYELTADENYMLTRLEHTDLLVDATQRPDPSHVIVPNDWLQALPAWAVVLDLSVDPYDFSRQPPSVKAIEGIPEGNLDQYVFRPDDPAFGLLPREVARNHRRTSLSCYSWPGVDPRACMEVYGKQVEPVLRAVVERGLENLDSAQGPYYERATSRATLAYWSSGK